jgi:hypothetical protein
VARVIVPEDVTLEPRPSRAPVVIHDDASNVASDVTPDSAATIKALEDHVATLKGEVKRLKAQASDEAAKTAQAIAAFESLAQRLEAMAEASARAGGAGLGLPG